jgi:hypothetical protein
MKNKNLRNTLLALLVVGLVLLTGAATFTLGRNSAEDSTKVQTDADSDEEQASTCTYEGKEFQDGETFTKDDGVNECICNNSTVVCTNVEKNEAKEDNVDDSNEDENSDSGTGYQEMLDEVKKYVSNYDYHIDKTIGDFPAIDTTTCQGEGFSDEFVFMEGEEVTNREGLISYLEGEGWTLCDEQIFNRAETRIFRKNDMLFYIAEVFGGSPTMPQEDKYTIVFEY